MQAFSKRPDDPNALIGWLDNIWKLLKSDVYTPTLTNVTNLDASTAFQAQYSRIGDVVTVSGKFEANPTATGQTELGVSLPIPSNIQSEQDCGGTFACEAENNAGAVLGDGTDKRAKFRWNAAHTGNRVYAFTFTYRIR